MRHPHGWLNLGVTMGINNLLRSCATLSPAHGPKVRFCRGEKTLLCVCRPARRMRGESQGGLDQKLITVSVKQTCLLLARSFSSAALAICYPQDQSLSKLT